MQLFQPDNFSESKIKYKKVFGDFNLVTILNHYFKEYTLNDVFQLDRPEINSENYKVLLEIEGKPAAVLVRKYKNLSDLNQILFYLGLLESLAEKRAPVSRAIKSSAGDLALKIDGEIFALFAFLDGDYFSPTEECLASVAESIAKLHDSFNILDESTVKQIGILSRQTSAYYNKIKNYSADDFFEIAETIEKKAAKDDNDRAVLERLPLFIATVAEIKDREKAVASLPPKIIHSDLHPHNILVKNGRVEAILDFDAVRISQQVRDVAFALYRFGRQFLIGKELEEAKSLAPIIRDVFIKSYRQFKAIPEKEEVLMPVLLKDEFIKKVLLVLKGIYLENNHTWAKDLSKFLVAIEEINYFWPKQ